MTGAALARALVDRGLDVGEFEAKRSLFDLVLSRFNALDQSIDSTGNLNTQQPVHAWWVPGRLEVFGTHTDYAGGHTLVCAVPRGFAVIGRRRPDYIVRVVDAGREQEVWLSPGQENEPAVASSLGWRRYVAAVSARLTKNFPGAKLGADIVLASDLPRASGMSSSSALLVAVATALSRAGALGSRDEWRGNIHDATDEAGYYACIENGSSFGSLAGDSGVGTHGGSEDHAAILTGTAGHVSPFTFVPMQALGIVRIPSRWRFVLTPSGVPAQKAGPALEAYNRLSHATRILLQLWNENATRPASSLREALIGSGEPRLDPDCVQHLKRLLRSTVVAGWTDDDLARRLDHFVREDSRTIEAVEAFRAADVNHVGQLAAESQLDADRLLGNQIPETIALTARARRLGAFASRSFGAGFGGSVWALIDSDRAEDFARRWSPDAFVAIPGPSLTELTDT